MGRHAPGTEHGQAERQEHGLMSAAAVLVSAGRKHVVHYVDQQP